MADGIDVLVVDDAPDVAESLAMVLDGGRTRVVIGAADALRVVAQTQPLALVDHHFMKPVSPGRIRQLLPRR